jgi:hypothetical protein
MIKLSEITISRLLNTYDRKNNTYIQLSIDSIFNNYLKCARLLNNNINNICL